MWQLPETFSWRYHVLFPAYAHLPPRWGQQLAAWQSQWCRQQRQQEEACIRAQIQHVWPETQPELLKRWLKDYYRMVEQEALDTWYLRHQSIEQLVDLQGFEAVAAARQQGQRVLLTSGHFGRFWLAGPAMRAAGFTTGTITRDGGQTNSHGLPLAEYHYRLMKLQRLQQVLGGPFLVEGTDIRPFYRVLDDHLIALIFDVPYTKAHKSCVTVEFMGGTIGLPAGIYRIAKKAKAVIAPFYMRDRGDGRVSAEFSALLNPSDYDETTLLSLLAHQLEQRILESPGHWWLWPALPLLRSNNNNDSANH